MSAENKLEDIVYEIEQSLLIRHLAAKRYGEEFGEKENLSVANAVASGHLDGKRYISLLEEGATLGRAWVDSETFGGQSKAFKEYAKEHSISGPLNIRECKLTKSEDNRQVAEQILERLGLDKLKIDEYQFRVCSRANYSKTSQATSYLNRYGIDRSLLRRDNLFWYSTGRIWGGLNLSKKQIIAVYHDPKDLMGVGSRVLDEGAMGYYGLVKENVTLRDLLLDGGVLIHNPRLK
jgi:hypothetical protein